MLRKLLLVVVLAACAAPSTQAGGDSTRRDSARFMRFDSGLCAGCEDLRPLLKTKGWPVARARVVELLANPLLRVRDEGVGWCIQFWTSDDIRFEDVEAVYREYKQGNGDFYWMAFRRAIADARIMVLPRAEKLRLLSDAVDSGGIDIFDGHRLEMSEALLLGIRGGFAELESRVQKNGELLERQLGLVASEGGVGRLVWEMRLRSGADTEANAEYLETERLVRMPVAELRTTLRSDAGFVAEVKMVTASVCGREGLIEACQNMSRMAELSLERVRAAEIRGAVEPTMDRVDSILVWVGQEARRRLSAH